VLVSDGVFSPGEDGAAELLDRLSKLVTPPRIHKHRYRGVLAPNAKPRKVVIESAGPTGATMRIIAFLKDPQVVERIPSHIGEPTQLELDFDQEASVEQQASDWPEMDQTVGSDDNGWD
jgi:hypothetical protein